MIRNRSKKAKERATATAANASVKRPAGDSGDSGDSVEPLEVMQEGFVSPTNGVFHRPDFPFILKATSVPMFQEDEWIACFRKLTDDQRVLGWMTFTGDTLGAADRTYDQNFIEVLRTYWKTLEKLRKEVGLSHIRETSIVAEEGNVWFLTARYDTWFALFVEGSTDVHEISNGLLASVTEL